MDQSTRISAKSDIVNLLPSDLKARNDVVLVEAAMQPEDFSPPAGWDFLAPDEARQFHVGVGDERALITLRVDEDTLFIAAPAHTTSPSDTLAVAVAWIVRALANAENTAHVRPKSSIRNAGFLAAVEKAASAAPA